MHYNNIMYDNIIYNIAQEKEKNLERARTYEVGVYIYRYYMIVYNVGLGVLQCLSVS